MNKKRCRKYTCGPTVLRWVFQHVWLYTSFIVSRSDFASLKESEAELNGQLGMNVLEQEFGICPIMTGKEMSTLEESDSLCMVMYLSQIHELLKDTAPPSGEYNAVCFCSPAKTKIVFCIHTIALKCSFS